MQAGVLVKQQSVSACVSVVCMCRVLVLYSVKETVVVRVCMHACVCVHACVRVCACVRAYIRT